MCGTYVLIAHSGNPSGYLLFRDPVPQPPACLRTLFTAVPHVITPTLASCYWYKNPFSVPD